MGDVGSFTHHNVAVVPRTLRTPLSANIINDYADAKPLSVARTSVEAKIFTSTDGGHTWTAYPGSAASLSAGHVAWHVYVDFFWRTLVNVNLITDLSCHRSANYGKTVSGLSGGITQT
jgi:hypothetical protein